MDKLSKNWKVRRLGPLSFLSKMFMSPYNYNLALSKKIINLVHVREESNHQLPYTV